MTLLCAHEVALSYQRPGTWRRNRQVAHAVAGVTFSVERATTLAIVGESGSGKSTLAKGIVGLLPTAEGYFSYKGERLPVRRPPALRCEIQMIFQDPASSLNPALPVGKMLADYLADSSTKDAKRQIVRDLLERVGLPSGAEHKRPAELSGGERQRVAIARALARKPAVLVADEPTSALDVSVQATILNLLRDIQADLGLTILFISHDLGVVGSVADAVIVLYRGQVIEQGPLRKIFDSPAESYTRELISATPRLDPVLPPRPSAPV